MKLPPQLVVLNGEHKGDVIVLDDPIPVVFGKRAGVRLPEPELDDVHCQVFPVEERWFLQDFGSRAGTWLGDDRVQGLRPLEFGRSFRIGATLIGFVLPDPEAPAHAVLAGDHAEDGDEAADLDEGPLDSSATGAYTITLEPPRDEDGPAAPAPDVDRHDFLGDYEIIQQLGEGTLGKVYKAFDGRRKRVVALKLLDPKLARDKTSVTRFLRGAKVGGRLQHPNIVSVLAAGHVRRQVYVAMEYVEGLNLEQTCQAAGGKLTPRQAVAILGRVVDALVYAHSRQVLHRNITPQNILVGPGGHPKLADLSLAKRQSKTSRPLNVTASDDVLVESPYAAPEAMFDASHVDERADVWGVGATLYRALTGKPPYPQATPAAYLQGELKDPRRLAPSVSEALAELLQRCLRPDPQDRFQAARELREAMAELPEAAPV